MGAFGYTLSDVRPLISQWNASLTDSDLSECVADTGIFYKKVYAEISEALITAAYEPTTDTPQAYQICHDLLASGIALYYIESHTASSYQDGYDPIAGGFQRYRARLRSIAAGNPLGELGQKKISIAGVYNSCPVPNPFGCR